MPVNQGTLLGAGGTAGQSERDKRNPVKIEWQKIAESEAAKDALRLKPLGDAMEQRPAAMKTPGEASADAYRSTTRKILRWADRVSVNGSIGLLTT